MLNKMNPWKKDQNPSSFGDRVLQIKDHEVPSMLPLSWMVMGAGPKNALCPGLLAIMKA